MVRRRVVTAFCLVVAMALCGGLEQAAAEEQQKETATDQKKNDKDAKGTNKDESVRDGINRAFDELKTDMSKGRKNLNDLYERSTSSAGDGKAK